MGRLQLYIAGSTVLANLVLLRAFVERPNFYSAAVYISQSTGSLMFLINLALIVTASLGYGLQRLFYGPLRPIETEQLYDKAWFAVSETLLAMTIFRDDIGLWFFTMFLCLLAGKVWQWIGEGRVEFLEQQPPANPKLFHARLMSSLLLSVAFDVFMVQYCVDCILADAKAGVMVMFGFEYVLLAIASVSTLLRYGLSLAEITITLRQEKARDEARRVAREERQRRIQAAEEAGEPVEEAEEEDEDDDVPGWEEKGRWLFFLDLMTDAIKSVVYVIFFVLLMTFYGIPIHIVRDLFMTVRSFFKRLHDFYQYRNATRDMNVRYPDATAEELERENTCIVCREEMQPWVQPGADGAQTGRRVDERQRPKKLPCGHILHFSCLRSWLERQQVCPTCRRPVLSGPVIPNNAPNQANPGQGAPQAPPVAGAFQPLQGNAPAPGHPAQPGNNQQQNPPQGNVRVFNLGPVRIALGNLRVPANPPANNANANNANNVNNVNNANNNNNLMERLVQQMAQQQIQQQIQQQNPHPAQPQYAAQSAPQMITPSLAPIPGAVAQHPNDIQADILRIQQNIVESMRQLDVQHTQLEYIYALLAELSRLQAARGQELPHIQPLNPQMVPSINPQAYFSNGNVLRQGDAGIPEGLTLPEGWTLRPMQIAPQHGAVRNSPAQAGSSGPFPPPPPQQPSSETAASSSSAPSALSTSAPSAPSTSAAPTASSPSPPADTASESDVTAGPSSKTVEPSSLESSWSFGNLGSNEAEGSSTAVAGSSTENQATTRRTAMVEDAADE